MKSTPTPSVASDPTTDQGSAAAAVSRRVPRSVAAAAWAVPIMVVGQFALLAAIPVVILLRRVLREPRLRVLRAPVGLLAAVYTIPLALWLLNPDRAQSLSKEISPRFVALIVAASALLLTTIWFKRRQLRATGPA